MDKYRVALTVKERLELEQMVSIGKAAARKLTHARILLLADERCGEAYADAEIVSALGTSPRTIERLRQRFVTEGLEAALDHRPQPARRAGAATGPYNCWLTNSSSWACSIPSAR